MAHLQQHAEQRAAPAHGQLLRYATGRAITARRYDHLWVRVGHHLPWVATQQISTHWLRHTTLTWVERNFGYATARAYAGHTDSGSASTTATYVRASLAEIATALATLTAEPHPLALGQPGAHRQTHPGPRKARRRTVVGARLPSPGGTADRRPATSLRLRNEIERLDQTVRELSTEADVRDTVKDLNQRIAHWSRTPSGPNLHLGPVDVDQVVQQWRTQRRRPPTEPTWPTNAEPTQPSQPRRPPRLIDRLFNRPADR